MTARKVLAIAGKGGKGGVFFAYDKSSKRSVGGIGGRGGSVFLSFSPDPLVKFSLHEKYIAGDGANGGNEGARGRSGIDIQIVSPRDYIWTDHRNSLKISSSSQESKSQIALATGGLGGSGNATMGKDLYEEGEYGQCNFYDVECRIVADFVLFGLPNSGKSTLMKCLAGVQTKISSIPFSTTTPRYFSVLLGNSKLVGADTPGIIDINSLDRTTENLLAHAKKVLVMVDLQRKQTLEYANYLRSMIPDGPQIITVGSKCDSEPAMNNMKTGLCDIAISCKSGLGIQGLVQYLIGRKRFNGLSAADKMTLSQESFLTFYRNNRHLIIPTYSAEYRLVKDIADRISQAAVELFGIFEYKPKVFVLKNQDANAMVLPGGEIFVFSGILGISKDPSELASVIGHEEVRYQLLTNRLFKSVLRNYQGIDIYSSLFSEMLLLMRNAGYDLQGALRFWTKMKAVAENSTVPVLLSTHPSSEERLKELMKYIEQLRIKD